MRFCVQGQQTGREGISPPPVWLNIPEIHFVILHGTAIAPEPKAYEYENFFM